MLWDYVGLVGLAQLSPIFEGASIACRGVTRVG